MNTQKGFVSVGIWIAIILGLVVVGGGAYFVMQQQPSSQTASENNFDTLQTSPTTQQNTNMTQPISPSPTAGTANWKTYRSEVWGIEFKYPSNFVLNTSKNEFWKMNSPYRDGYDFLELVDTPSGCYIGPVLAVGLGPDVTQSNKSVRMVNGESLTIRYISRGDSGIFIGLADTIAPDGIYDVPLNVTSLSSGIIKSDYKNTSSNRSLSDNCVKDFETILTTLKFTK